MQKAKAQSMPSISEESTAVSAAKKRKGFAKKSPSSLQLNSLELGDTKSHGPPPKRSQSNLKLTEDKRRNSHPLPSMKATSVNPQTILKPETDVAAYRSLGFNPIPLDLGNTKALEGVSYKIYQNLGSKLIKLVLKEEIDKTKPRIIEDYEQYGYHSHPLKKVKKESLAIQQDKAELAIQQDEVCKQLAGQYVPNTLFTLGHAVNFVMVLVKGEPTLFIGDCPHFYISACNPWAIAAGDIKLIKNAEGKSQLYITSKSGAYPARSVGPYDEYIKRALRDTLGVLDSQITLYVASKEDLKAIPEGPTKQDIIAEVPSPYSSTAQVAQLLGGLTLKKSSSTDLKDIAKPPLRRSATVLITQDQDAEAASSPPLSTPLTINPGLPVAPLPIATPSPVTAALLLNTTTTDTEKLFPYNKLGYT